MRLQLNIERHGLPTVRILWPVYRQDAPHAATLQPIDSSPSAAANEGTRTALQVRRDSTSAGTGSRTIAQLLDDVNEKVPLESEDGEGNGWGLEDYVVKNVKGYDCLYYDTVQAVLRDGEEVVIRPRTHQENKEWRIGGREQITSDGKHLLDGAPFGRVPLRRATDRPSVSIPPWKKPRLELEWEATPDVLVDADLDEEESEDDEDYVEGGEDESDGQETDDDEDEGITINDEDKENLPSRQVMLRTDFDDADVDEEVVGEDTFLGFDDEEEEEWHGFASSQERPNGVLGGDAAADVNGTLRRSGSLRGGDGTSHDPSVREKITGGLSWRQPDDFGNVTRRKKNGRGATRGGLSQDLASSSLIRVLEDPALDEDGGSEDSESTTRLEESTTLVSKVVAPTAGDPKLVDQTLEDDETSSSGTSDSESTSDSDSDSDSDNDSDSDSSSESDSDESASDDSALSTSSSSSSSDEEESEVEGESTIAKDSSPLGTAKQAPVSLKQTPQSGPKKTANPMLQPAEVAEQSTKSPAQPPNPPGQGTTQTRRRNQRYKLKRLQAAGKLGPNATLEDLEAYVLRPPDIEGSVTSDFGIQKQKLLDALASDGVDVEMHDGQAGEGSETSKIAKGPIFVENRLLGRTIDPFSPATAQVPADVASEPPPKRSKLDISSTRRLLFGSLGVRAPKTRQEEEDTRRKLAGSPRVPAKQYEKATTMEDPNNSTLVVNDTPPNNQVQVLDSQGGEDAWKSKITLKAVECCYEGVELSEPPFPFVQRWDPQQQSRGQKRKRVRSNFTTDRHNQRYQHQEAEEEEEDANVELDYDDTKEPVTAEDESAGDNGAIRDQLMREADGLSASSPQSELIPDDMSPLPADLTSSPQLTTKTATFGSIIAFKEMRMDDEWSPYKTGYLTAHIDRVLDDGTLELTLARRDWRKKKLVIDRLTGKRTRHGLDMEEEDDGKRLEKLNALVDPILIKPGEPYYEPMASELAEEQVTEEATKPQEPEDMPLLQKPSLEPEIENRLSLSLQQDTQERSSDSETPEKIRVALATSENPSLEMGATDKPSETQEMSITQLDGSRDGSENIDSCEEVQMRETTVNEDSFFGEAAVKETPASPLVNASLNDAHEDAPETEFVHEPATSPPHIPTGAKTLRAKDASELRRAISEQADAEESWTTKDSEMNDEQASQDRDGNGQANSINNQIPSPKFNGFGSRPHDLFASPHRRHTSSTPNGTPSAKSTPKAKSPSKGVATPEYSNLALANEDYPSVIPSDDVFQEFDEAPIVDDDSQDLIEDSIVASGSIQDGQKVGGPRHEISEDDSLLNPISLAKEDSLKSRSSLGLDGAADDDDLPDLDPFFPSTAPARMNDTSPPTTKRSQKKATKVSQKHEKEEVRRWPFSQEETANPAVKPSKKKSLFSSKYAGYAASSQDRPLDFAGSTDPDYDSRSSQPAPASQIVDLTQTSSPAVSPDRSETQSIVSSRDLPRGSRWIKKEAKSQSSEESRRGFKVAKFKKSVI